MFKIEGGNEALTDGQTNGHSNAFLNGGYYIIPPFFLKWQYIIKPFNLIGYML